MGRVLVAAGSFAMAVGVGLGAYSSHATRGAVHPEAARLLQIAVLYHFVHGLGIVAAGTLALWRPSRWLAVSGALMLAGIATFCGGLWYLALSGHSAGLVTPVGGLAFMAGWLALAGGAIFGEKGTTP